MIINKKGKYIEFTEAAYSSGANAGETILYFNSGEAIQLTDDLAETTISLQAPSVENIIIDQTISEPASVVTLDISSLTFEVLRFRVIVSVTGVNGDWDNATTNIQMDYNDNAGTGLNGTSIYEHASTSPTGSHYTNNNYFFRATSPVMRNNDLFYTTARNTYSEIEFYLYNQNATFSRPYAYMGTLTVGNSNPHDTLSHIYGHVTDTITSINFRSTYSYIRIAAGSRFIVEKIS